MKRLIYLVLCLFTCMTLMTACGNDDTASEEPQVRSETNNNVDTKKEDDAAISDDTDSEDMQEIVLGDGTDIVEADDTDDSDDDTDDDSDDDDDLTIPQQNAAESPEEEFHASGTFNGFVDSSSVEITLADGTYQTFFVYEEDVYNRLMALSDSETSPTIQFIYKAKDGQVNPEIIAVN